ncbi:hypothetical protein AB0D59_40165 [Streptomyces sp. NPDC048417]|uniref:hypothetical protein n=1 Tax=Streptomyces sp. NPDC048417 TaxID=3155387 RepID=UPI00341C1F2C
MAYLRAAAGIGFTPWDCPAVEDSPNGIRSAAADMRVLAVSRGGTELPAHVAHLPVAQARGACAALSLLTRLFTPGPRPRPAAGGGAIGSRSAPP